MVFNFQQDCDQYQMWLNNRLGFMALFLATYGWGGNIVVSNPEKTNLIWIHAPPDVSKPQVLELIISDGSRFRLASSSDLEEVGSLASTYPCVSLFKCLYDHLKANGLEAPDPFALLGAFGCFNPWVPDNMLPLLSEFNSLEWREMNRQRSKRSSSGVHPVKR